MPFMISIYLLPDYLSYWNKKISPRDIFLSFGDILLSFGENYLSHSISILI